ncbi:putative NADPH:quinone oxidoreductase 1 [Arthrobacter sp. PAMC 25486]|uniref:NADPH-dependent FMN reductase n=1 Tax=Arthrobacter sp. PAMC 25486 TaxID=1494608 RepID=UPI000535C42F|nr:NADPH-dependent FMN reductase [Arthrobacter sp. PAMC 25486]AIY03245.1 putative NADPH:quinone oxidoreductase 1 [Arthrobacter sp. PAMC 25486]
MSLHKKISILVGSLRAGSYARQIAINTIELFPSNYHAEILEIRDLPLYDFDYDDPEVSNKLTPVEYTQFRENVKDSDGVLFITPENNRTIPACLKNAVDIGSKPNGDVAWKNKPVGIISHSVGRMGGYSSQKNLRLALSYFDMPTPGQPEAFLSQSPSLINADGTMRLVSTINFLQDYITRFAQVVEDHPRK